MPLADVVAEVEEHAERLERSRLDADLPREPDRARVDGWLHRSHLALWERGASARSVPPPLRG